MHAARNACLKDQRARPAVLERTVVPACSMVPANGYSTGRSSACQGDPFHSSGSSPFQFALEPGLSYSLEGNLHRDSGSNISLIGHFGGRSAIEGALSNTVTIPAACHLSPSPALATPASVDPRPAGTADHRPKRRKAADHRPPLRPYKTRCFPNKSPIL